MYKLKQELNILEAVCSLSRLSNDELKELLNNDEKFEDMVKDINPFKDLKKEAKKLIKSNRSLAISNLSKQDKLEEDKRTLKRLSEQANQLCANVKDKFNEIRDESRAITADSTLDMLRAASAKVEEESNAVVAKFDAGEIEAGEFLKQFLPQRQLMHLRYVKVDKLKELIMKNGLSNDSLGSRAALNFPGMAPSVLYPNGPSVGPITSPSQLQNHRRH